MATQNMQAMQLLAPDIAQEQQQLSRRQQMADLLRKQSLDPASNTEVINGWAVKKSPFEGLSKIVQAFGANYIQDKADSRQLELAKALQGRLGSIASGGGAGLSSDDAATASLATNSAGPTNANAATQAKLMEPVAAPENNKYNNQNLLRSLAINALGGNQASGAFWDDQKKTEGQKTNEYLGIGTPQAKRDELAKRLKDGTMSFTPGQMNQLPDGSKVVAPNFDTGVMGGFDSQDRPFASEIPGVANIAANRAGSVKQAEAAIADRFAVPTAVDAAGGRTALTPAQQRTMAYGGVDPAYQNAAPSAAPSMFQAPKPVSKSPLSHQAADTDRTQIFQSEMNSARGRLASAKTPDERQRAQADIESLTRETRGIGIRLQDDAQKAKEVATAQADVVRDTSQQKEGKLRSQLTAGVDRAIDLLKQGPTASGAGSMIDSASNFFGKSTKGADLASQLDTLSGWLTSNVPRMEGPQSDKDVASYRIMSAEVGDRTKPVSQRLAAANELKIIQAKYAHLNGGPDNSGGSTGQWDGDNPAPSNGGFKIIGVK